MVEGDWHKKTREDMYSEATDLIWRSHYEGAGITITTLELYVNGTIIQFNRIQANRETLPWPGPGVDKLQHQTLFLDIHFYFICYDKARNLLEHLAKFDGDPKLEDICQTRKEKFNHFSKARHTLEHIENGITRKNFSDFCNFGVDGFTHGGNHFEISESSLKILTDAYEQVVAILRLRPVDYNTSYKSG